jgi:hypothetical protein
MEENKEKKKRTPKEKPTPRGVTQAVNCGIGFPLHISILKAPKCFNCGIRRADGGLSLCPNDCSMELCERCRKIVTEHDLGHEYPKHCPRCFIGLITAN